MVQLEELTAIRAPIERCFDLARSVEVHLAGNVHFGEQAVASAGVTSGLVDIAQRVTWRAKHFGVWQTFTSRITAMQSPVYFQDVMVQGAFRFMRHDHYFRRLASGETEMKDIFCFAAPFPLLGLLAETLVLRRYMRALLQERNLVIKQIAEGSDWRQYLTNTGGNEGPKDGRSQ
jgi:ligand-binding SRPBCC domain-containing protein